MAGNILVGLEEPFQFIPSLEYAIVLLVPLPTATHVLYALYHVMPFPANENMLLPTPVHSFPSYEYAIVFCPVPTATHIEPFHATLFPLVENIVVELLPPILLVAPVQFCPSEE